MTNNKNTFPKYVELEKYNPLTEKIIGCAYKVSNTLGVGFVEKVYENCLAIELRTVGLVVKQQHSIDVFYGSNLVGEFTADLLVEDCVLLELKAVKELNDIHQAQAINYLKASGLRLCLLINFGKRRIDIKRLAL